MTDITPITLIIADDHALVREGIAALCSAQSSIEVAGQCSDGLAAYELIRDLKPDFAILDLNMPRLTGIEVVRKLRENGSPTRVIIVSISRDEHSVTEALRAGANAYLLKDGPSRHLLEAIRFIQEGGVYVSPLLGGAAILTGRVKPEESDPLSCLSNREYEVFTQLVNGVRPRDIARMLDISPKTVDTYRASLMRKLNVHDLVELVKFAIDKKLISPSP